MLSKQLENVINKYNKENLTTKEKKKFYNDMLDLNATMTMINLDKSQIEEKEINKIYSNCEKLVDIISQNDDKYIYMIGLFNSTFSQHIDYLKDLEEYKEFKKEMKGSILNPKRMEILRLIYKNKRLHLSQIEEKTSFTIKNIQDELVELSNKKCVRSLINGYFELTYFGKRYLDDLYSY